MILGGWGGVVTETFSLGLDYVGRASSQMPPPPPETETLRLEQSTTDG